jgi:hypothetical protein
MMLFKSIVVGLFCFTASLALSSPISVFVDAGTEIGQGLLVSHNQNCHLITPAHVVSGTSFVYLSGRGGKPPLGDGIGGMVFGYDLSVLDVEGELFSQCGQPFDSVNRKIEKYLVVDSLGEVNIVNQDGSVYRVPVAIVDQSLTYLKIKPTDVSDQFLKGMSGSLLTVQGEAIGMLMSVSDGVGNVLRTDRLLETITPYFRNTKASYSSKAGPDSFILQFENEIQDIKVVRWSSRAIDSTHRAANVLVRDSSVAPWITSINALPESITFELPESSKIQNIYVSDEGLENNTSMATTIEVLLDISGSGAWRSYGVMLPAKVKGRPMLVFDLLGRSGKQVMLRLHSNKGNGRSIGLGKVYITSN